MRLAEISIKRKVKSMSRSLSGSFLKSGHLCYLARRSPERLSTVRAGSNIPSVNTPEQEEPSNVDPLLRKLEDVIHRIIVRRSAPDWLPFLPGSSYWVPPPRSSASSLELAHLVERLARPIPGKESISASPTRGWPSPDYFINGSHSLDVGAKVTLDKVEVVITSSHLSESEDEEG